MKFCPGFDEPLLRLRQTSTDHFERFDAVDRYLVMVERSKAAALKSKAAAQRA